MNTKDLLTIATAALGTATLTVVAFWAGPIDAGNDADTPPPKIAKARFVSHGIELSLAPAGGCTFKAGDQPEFELTALNTTHQAATAAITVTLSASSPPDPMARTIRLPSMLWQQDQSLTLKPSETKTLTLSARTNLPPNSVISVSLRDQNPGAGPVPAAITALSFSTLVPGARPVFALNR